MSGVLFAVELHVGISCPRKSDHDRHHPHDSPRNEYPPHGPSLHSHLHVRSLWDIAAIVQTGRATFQSSAVCGMDVWGHLCFRDDTSRRSERQPEEEDRPHDCRSPIIRCIVMRTDIYGSHPPNYIHAEWQVGIPTAYDYIGDLCGRIGLVLVGILQSDVFRFGTSSLEIKPAQDMRMPIYI